MTVVTHAWQAFAALVDPVRRALYDHVRAQDHPVTREQAADATGISRGLAAHHLDKLVDAGLLHARYQRPDDQPRVRGRNPKVYEPAGEDIALSIPERRYELAGRILADAIAEAPGDAGNAACAVAERYGRILGRQATGAPPPRGAAAHPPERQAAEPDMPPRELAVACRVLDDLGFSPRRRPDDVVLLDNCPFHALALRQPELVCALNHALLAGLLDGLGSRCLEARFAPRPGACCVEIHTAAMRPDPPTTGVRRSG